MTTTLSRAAYADMFGPTTGDRVRLADTALFIEVEKDFTIYGEEVKFGGGKVIRDGMGQSQRTRRAKARWTRSSPTRVDPRPLGHRQGRYRPQGRPHRRHRQGRQSGHPAGRHHRHRAAAPRSSPAKARSSPPAASTRHIHFICPQQIEEALMSRRHHHAGRRHRPGGRHLRHHLHARALAHRAHDRGRRRVSDEPRLRSAKATPSTPDGAASSRSRPAPAR